MTDPIELAEKCGVYPTVRGRYPGKWVATEEELRTFAAAVREEALLEAVASGLIEKPE